MIETDTIEADTIETDTIAGMTGVIVETTDAMTEVATMDGIAGEVTIVMMITDMIGIAACATTTDRASSNTVRHNLTSGL